MIYSYSAIKDFENCPRKFHETRVLKKYKSKDTEATLYGTEVHKAFEDLVVDGTPLPPKFEQFQSYMDSLASMDGDIRCEQKIGIRADFTPCDFFAEDAWFRGVPDFLALNMEKGVAHIADYKTGKSSRYADSGQLELMAALVMAHHPEIKTVKCALLFVVAGDVIVSKYTRAELPEIFSKWAGRANRIEMAVLSEVWNPKSSGLCGFCPVESCESYRPRR